MHILITLLLFASILFAHRPLLPSGIETYVDHPEISTAYYGRLEGQSHRYIIKSQEPFHLFVQLLLPYGVEASRGLRVSIDANGTRVAVLDAAQSSWEYFFEPFGHDAYWIGPTYEAYVPQGTYTLAVDGVLQNEIYILAIGEAEDFGVAEILQTLALVPHLKRDIFKKTSFDFMLSPFGLGYFLIIGGVGIMLGRWSAHFLHGTIWVKRTLWVLSVLGMTWMVGTSWHPFGMLFFAWCLGMAWRLRHLGV